MCMENCEIRVCLHPTTGGLLAIMDVPRNISYEFVSSGFSLTADGTRYFVDSQAVSFEKTDTGIRVLFKDGPFVAECIYTVPEKGAFVERQLRFMCESGMWTAEKIVCEHAVFAKEAEIYPFDTVLSHFPKDERFDNTGRLDEERRRTEEMLKAAQDKVAFLLFNETFSGTDDKRGFDLLTDTVAKIAESKHLGLYVTHFHEVMSLDFPVLSAEVDSTDENKRTFHIVRSKGSSSSYAVDILKKYGLDKNSLEARRCGNGN